MSYFLSPARFAWAALLISGALLGGAWVFQYGLGYAPCQMCYWQRHPHKVILLISVITLITAYVLKRKTPLVFLTALLALGFMISTGLGLWHVGVELGVLEGPKSCLSGPLDINKWSGKDLMDSLDQKIKPPACSDVVWSFLGLSMAGWNALISFAGGVLALMSIRKGETA